MAWILRQPPQVIAAFLSVETPHSRPENVDANLLGFVRVKQSFSNGESRDALYPTYK